MIVGEPIPLGSDTGQEDERQITRLENNHFRVVPTHKSQRSPLLSAADASILNGVDGKSI